MRIDEVVLTEGLYDKIQVIFSAAKKVPGFAAAFKKAKQHKALAHDIANDIRRLKPRSASAVAAIFQKHTSSVSESRAPLSWGQPGYQNPDYVAPGELLSQLFDILTAAPFFTVIMIALGILTAVQLRRANQLNVQLQQQMLSFRQMEVYAARVDVLNATFDILVAGYTFSPEDWETAFMMYNNALAEIALFGYDQHSAGEFDQFVKNFEKKVTQLVVPSLRD